MPRPCKKRRICCEPVYNLFGPIYDKIDSNDLIIMTLDEYECIRLIDIEGITQEECADSMNIARTTVQAIYKSAREKIAKCIVQGKKLEITGGNYTICDGNASCFGDKICIYKKELLINKKDENAKRVAITYENNKIFQHFGKTENFIIYDIIDKKIINIQMIENIAKGPANLIGILKSNDVDYLICGKIGDGAKKSLSRTDITLINGITGNVDEIINKFIKNNLKL